MTTDRDQATRDRLALRATAVGDMPADWWCPKREGLRRDECRYCIAEYVVDALLPVVADLVREGQAEGERRVLDFLTADAERLARRRLFRPTADYLADLIRDYKSRAPHAQDQP